MIIWVYKTEKIIGGLSSGITEEVMFSDIQGRFTKGICED